MEPCLWDRLEQLRHLDGWETKSGLRVVSKDGGQPGVSTIMYLVPEENLACVAPANRSDNGEPAAQKTPMGEVAGTT